MNIERLRKIIAYSDKNHEDIYSMVKRFCAFARIEYDSDLLNILQIVRSSFEKKGLKLEQCAIEVMDWDMSLLIHHYLE